MSKINVIRPFTMLLMLALTLGFVACHKSNDDFSNNGAQITPASGKWHVQYFFDKSDETSNYASYEFEFNAGGSMTAVGNGQNYSGAWLSGYDDSASKFLIQWSGVVPSALQELAEDWRIIQMDGQFMHFEHTSGGNGDTDVLKFVKL
ncbi:MAG: hypothetical protein R3A50_01330 [Saprospiraceae bacterium]